MPTAASSREEVRRQAGIQHGVSEMWLHLESSGETVQGETQATNLREERSVAASTGSWVFVPYNDENDDDNEYVDNSANEGDVYENESDDEDEDEEDDDEDEEDDDEDEEDDDEDAEDDDEEEEDDDEEDDDEDDEEDDDDDEDDDEDEDEDDEDDNDNCDHRNSQNETSHRSSHITSERPFGARSNGVAGETNSQNNASIAHSRPLRNVRRRL